MKFSEITRGTPLKVIWVDAESQDGWLDNSDMERWANTPVGEVATVGMFYNYVTNSHITLLGGTSHNQSMHALAIPLGWIRAIYVLSQEVKVEV